MKLSNHFHNTKTLCLPQNGISVLGHSSTYESTVVMTCFVLKLKASVWEVKGCTFFQTQAAPVVLRETRKTVKSFKNKHQDLTHWQWEVAMEVTMVIQAVYTHASISTSQRSGSEQVIVSHKPQMNQCNPTSTKVIFTSLRPIKYQWHISGSHNPFWKQKRQYKFSSFSLQKCSYNCWQYCAATGGNSPRNLEGRHKNEERKFVPREFFGTA